MISDEIYEILRDSEQYGDRLCKYSKLLGLLSRNALKSKNFSIVLLHTKYLEISGEQLALVYNPAVGLPYIFTLSV